MDFEADTILGHMANSTTEHAEVVVETVLPFCVHELSILPELVGERGETLGEPYPLDLLLGKHNPNPNPNPGGYLNASLLFALKCVVTVVTER